MVAIMILRSTNFQEKSLDLVYLHSTKKDNITIMSRKIELHTISLKQQGYTLEHTRPIHSYCLGIK